MCYFFEIRFLMDYSGDSHTRKDEQNHEDMRYSLVKSQMTI